MNYLQELKNSLSKPKKFFRRPLQYTIQESLIYFLVVLAITGVVSYLVSVVYHKRLSAPFVDINEFVLYLPVLIAWLFIEALVLYWIARLVKGTGNFKQTLAVAAFSRGSYIFSPIPYVNLLTLYGFYLLVLGLKNTHGYGWLKAVLTIAIPNLIFLLILELLGLASFDRLLR